MKSLIIVMICVTLVSELARAASTSSPDPVMFKIKVEIDHESRDKDAQSVDILEPTGQRGGSYALQGGNQDKPVNLDGAKVDESAVGNLITVKLSEMVNAGYDSNFKLLALLADKFASSQKLLDRYLQEMRNEEVKLVGLIAPVSGHLHNILTKAAGFIRGAPSPGACDNMIMPDDSQESTIQNRNKRDTDGCDNCVSCYNCPDSSDCINCSDLVNCHNDTNCHNCCNSANCRDCTNCQGCTNCYNCNNCTNCHKCYGCSNKSNCSNLTC